MILWQIPLLLPSTESTQDYLLNQPNPLLNTVVYTHHQTKGRGTHEKTWISNEKDLIFSFQFDHELTEGHLMMVIALSLVKIFETHLMIKPPNDLLLEGKKCGGILIEQKQIQKGYRATVGIGINITPKDDLDVSVIKTHQTLESLITSFQDQLNQHLSSSFDILFQQYEILVPWHQIKIKYQGKTCQFQRLHPDLTLSLDIGTFPMAHLSFEII